MPAETVSELYRALMLTYERCIKAKPAFKKSRFHMEYAQEIYRLAFDIVHRRYVPSVSNIFVVFYPKPREIIAAHLRDRIVHHYIYEYMAPFWEPRFSPRSYACRKGRGPLRAVQDLSGFVRGFRAHSAQPLYYLKVDIAAFFPSLDLDILRSIIMKKLTHPTWRYLVDTTLNHRPVDPGQFNLKCPREYWKKIPRHKSMFYAPRNKGLPIGNLTSQFFANVYLNELDQFITHKLKGHYVYWQRYVDDVLFLANDPDALRQLPALLDEFLRTKLALRLNPAKTIMQPLDRGLDHLGFWIKSDHRLVRQKNVKVCFTKLRSGAESPEGMQATLNSYMGLFRSAASKSLRCKIGRELAKENFFDGRLDLDSQAERVVVTSDLNKAAEEAAEERAFVEEFKRHVEPERAGRYLQEWKSVGAIFRDAAAFLA